MKAGSIDDAGTVWPPGEKIEHKLSKGYVKLSPIQYFMKVFKGFDKPWGWQNMDVVERTETLADALYEVLKEKNEQQ